MRFRTATRAALVVAGLIWAGGAQAVPISCDANGNNCASLTISSGALTVEITVNNCNLSSVCQGGVSQIVQDQSNQLTQSQSYIGVVVKSSTANNDFLSSGDLTFDMTVTELSGPPLSSLVLADNGVTHSSVGITLNTPSGFGGSPGAVPGAPDSFSYTPVAVLNETLDASATFFGSSDPITSVTQDFVASEPTTFSLLVLGVSTTLILRRRRARRSL